jgi:hypothetical protein
MTKDEALKLALSTLDEVRQETFRLMRDGQKLYAEDKVWSTIISIKEVLAQPERDYERGFIDGMQKQMQSSVDRAVNAMTQPTYYIPSKDQRTWIGLSDEEIKAFDTWHDNIEEEVGWCNPSEIVAYIEAKLKQKNGYAEEKNT